jgi:hypothetical protein
MTKPFNYTLALLAATLAIPSAKAADILGIDVSSAQGTINWASVASDGVVFAYVHAPLARALKIPISSPT